MIFAPQSVRLKVIESHLPPTRRLSLPPNLVARPEYQRVVTAGAYGELDAIDCPVEPFASSEGPTEAQLSMCIYVSPYYFALLKGIGLPQ